jgi:hypothetical protein
LAVSHSAEKFVVKGKIFVRKSISVKTRQLLVAAKRYTYALILLYPTLAVAYFLSVYSVL